LEYGIAPHSARATKILDMIEINNKGNKVPIRAQEKHKKDKIETER
jgi:hypothetical protein